MQTEPQVSFDDLPVDEAVRDAALDHIAQLERLSDRITGCHVVVAQPHRHHREGRLYSVRVDVVVPGGEIVVNRDQHLDHAHADVYVALRDAFLAATRILVCLLPATAETRHILASPLLDKLPDGAGLVNVGRGSQQKIEDILAALDNGKLSGAVLDVFEQEPLPAEHPAWTHPKLLVTPHLASLPPRSERAAHVATLIAAYERGDARPNRYDHARGY